MGDGRGGFCGEGERARLGADWVEAGTGTGAGVGAGVGVGVGDGVGVGVGVREDVDGVGERGAGEGG